MRHVREAAINGSRLGGYSVVLGLLGFFQFAQPATLFFAAFPLRFILRLAD
jgi:hypothetical protein